MNKTNCLTPPYPRMGEVYRALALALDTKAKNRDVDRYAREGDFDWTLPEKLIDELFFRPLCNLADAEFAGLVCRSLSDFHGNYIGLVATIGLDSLVRSEALPILIENYFAAHGAAFVHQLRERFGGPDLLLMLQSDRNPIATLFEWVTPARPLELGKAAFPETTGSDKTSREMIGRWVQGTQLPDASSAKLFLNALNRHGTSEQREKIPQLKRWLFVARALEWFERQAPNCNVRAAMRAHILVNFPAQDIGKVLFEAVWAGGDRLEPLKMPGLMLAENLKRTQAKAVGDQESRRQDLVEYEHLANRYDPEGRTRYLLAWFRGRWEVLSGNHEAARHLYREAVELANYRAGQSQKEILQEALVLGGLLEDKPFLKQLKQQAIALGILVPPADQEASVVEDWEVEHLRANFLSVFPNEARFVEANEDSAITGRFSVLLFDAKEMDSREPDLRNPNRTVTLRLPDAQTRRWPQLRLFASFGRVEAVRTLLGRGADVNALDEHGGSALLCAIQYAQQTGDRGVLDLLLSVSHQPETIDSLTSKKQISPLLEAIDYGQPDVVESLLRMGANPEIRGNIIGETPLYLCMGILGRIRYPAKTYSHLYNSLYADWDLVQCETMRRYGVSMAGVFGEKAGLAERLADPRNLQIYEQLVTVMVDMMLKRHSVPKLIRIAELLLSNGANPNAVHHYPAPGRTPLMLAAEDNCGWAFDLMLRHGGNPYQTDSAGMDCPKVAMAFRSAEVVGYMRSKGIM